MSISSSSPGYIPSGSSISRVDSVMYFLGLASIAAQTLSSIAFLEGESPVKPFEVSTT